MYEGIGDEVIIISTGDLGRGRRARIIPVRTIADIRLSLGTAGDTITIRTHGGEGWRIPHLGGKSCRRLCETILERMRELEAEK